MNSQLGPRSTGQSATGHPLLLVILIGRLYPSTRETRVKDNFLRTKDGTTESKTDHHSNPSFHFLVESILQLMRGEHPMKQCHGTRQKCMRVAHGSCMRVAKEPSVASTIQTRIWTGICTEITVPSTLPSLCGLRVDELA